MQALRGYNFVGQGRGLLGHGMVDISTFTAEISLQSLTVGPQIGNVLNISLDFANDTGEAANFRIVGVPTGEAAPSLTQVLATQANDGSGAEIDIDLPAFDGSEPVSGSVTAGVYDFYAAGETVTSGTITGVRSHLGFELAVTSAPFAHRRIPTIVDNTFGTGSTFTIDTATLGLAEGETAVLLVGSGTETTDITVNGNPVSRAAVTPTQHVGYWSAAFEYTFQSTDLGGSIDVVTTTAASTNIHWLDLVIFSGGVVDGYDTAYGTSSVDPATPTEVTPSAAKNAIYSVATGFDDTVNNPGGEWVGATEQQTVDFGAYGRSIALVEDGVGATSVGYDRDLANAQKRASVLTVSLSEAP